MNNAKVRTRLIVISSAIVLGLFPLAAFAITYQPGQTLNPSCLPTDPTCVVATSTFAGNITVAGTASSTNVVVSNSFTFGTLTGVLQAVGGAISTALVNLATQVTGILPVANGGTGWSSLAAGSILFGNGSSSIATSSNLYWDNTDGWLGIGTSTPGSILSVQGVANWTTATSTYYATGGINLMSGCFAVNGACIGTGSGNMIGTQGELAYFTGTNTAAGTSTLTLTSAGLFGIGTTSPVSTLAVAGSGYFTGSVNDASGYQMGGTTVLTYASSVLAVGPSSGLYASGDDVTAVGVGAVASTSPGFGDTGVGYEALANANGDFYDTAVGTQALKDMWGGGSGTAGNDEVAVGMRALENTTGGVNDTAVGAQSLINNLTGDNDTAVGMAVLDEATSSTGTVAMGWSAGYGNSSGYNNQGGTYIGFAAGGNVSTGSNFDTLLGFGAGNNLTTGADNILIGPDSSLTTNHSGGAYANLTTGSQNIAIGYDISLPSATANGQLDIGNVLFGSGITGTGSTIAGNVGIGTTTPYSRLEGWGPDTASTSAFLVANSASTTEFSVFDTGNATLAGSLIQNSDQRLKTNIQSLDGSSSLSLIDELNPVTFNWIDPNKGTTLQLGFIAQQVQQIFPNLISTTSPTALTPDGTLSLNYIGLISPIVSAIQEMHQQLTSLANTVAGFANSFGTNQLTFVRGQGTEIDVQTANVQTLCVGSVCVTPAQFQAMVAASGQTGTSAGSTDDTQATETPPVIQVNGGNPAIVQVGATYNDLGATITGPTADLNLGLQTFVNGVAMSPVQIDTSAAATDTIDYVATDQNSLTSTSTRTVIIEAPAIVPSADASTTDATTTNQ